MYMLREATSFNYIYDLYFVLMILIGSFFLMNLLIAVQFNSFYESNNFEKEKIEEANKQKKGEDLDNAELSNIVEENEDFENPEHED